MVGRDDAENIYVTVVIVFTNETFGELEEIMNLEIVIE